MERSVGTLETQTYIGSALRVLGWMVLIVPSLLFPSVGFPIMISLALVATLNYFIAYDADLRYANEKLENSGTNPTHIIESASNSEAATVNRDTMNKDTVNWFKKVEAKMESLNEKIRQHGDNIESLDNSIQENEEMIVRLDETQVNHKLNNDKSM